MAKKSTTNKSIMYLAIVAIALLLMPLLINAVQQQAFMAGYAAGNDNVYRVENW